MLKNLPVLSIIIPDFDIVPTELGYTGALLHPFIIKKARLCLLVI